MTARSKLLSTALMTAAAGLIATPVLAQGVTTQGNSSTSSATGANAHTPGMMARDNSGSSSTYMTASNDVRASKIVGASVYNDQNTKIGSIDDILVNHTDKATTAVISVGGFLGMDSKLVSVPYDKLQVQSNRIVMPGATKNALEGMPTFSYSKG